MSFMGFPHQQEKGKRPAPNIPKQVPFKRSVPHKGPRGK